MGGATPTIVGRTPELDVLHDALETVARGRGGVVLIEGEAGLGKTKLLDVALADDRHTILIEHGRADELEQHRPFGPLRTTLGLSRNTPDPRRRAVAQLMHGDTPPGDSPVQMGDVNDSRFRAVEAVADLIQQLANVEPMVLAIDDLQWADEATLLALRQLGRRTAYSPLLLVLAMRPPAPGSDLARFVASLVLDGARSIRLDALGAEEVDALVELTLGAKAGRTLQPALRGAAGSPLYLTELLRALAAENAASVVDGRVECTRPELPVSFVETVRRHVDMLPPAHAAVLQAAAIAGSEFTPEELSAVLDRPALELVDPLAESMRAGVIEDRDERLAFRHELFRQAIYEGTPKALRRERHRALARALIDAGGAAERIAWHLGQSADPPDRDIAEWLRTAAVAESVAAPGIAADLLQRALDFLPTDDPDREAVASDLATELVWDGRTTEGIAIARTVLDQNPHAPRVREAIALALLLEGKYAEAVTEIDLAAAEENLPELARLHLRAEAGLARFLSGDVAGAARDGDAAFAAGAELGDPLSTTVGLCTLAWAANARGDGARALELANEAVARAEGVSRRATAAYAPHLFLGIVLIENDRLAEAEQTLRTAIEVTEKTGTLMQLPTHYASLALLLYELGLWDDAVAEADAGIVAAGDLGVDVGLIWLCSLRAYISVQRDDIASARLDVDTAEAALLATGPQVGLDWLMRARAAIAEVDGPAAALPFLNNAWILYEALGVRTHRPTIGIDLVRVAIAAGDPAAAQPVVDALRAETDTNPSARKLGLATFAAGQVANDADQIVASLELLGSTTRPFEVALATDAAAIALAGAGRKDEARVRFDEAATLYNTLGATRAAARLQASERTAGITRGKRGTRKRPAKGWESLTATEHGVVRLVAEGLTNRQIGERLFVSPRTVETHIAHVFAKLDVTSRVELARAVPA